MRLILRTGAFGASTRYNDATLGHRGMEVRELVIVVGRTHHPMSTTTQKASSVRISRCADKPSGCAESCCPKHSAHPLARLASGGERNQGAARETWRPRGKPSGCPQRHKKSILSSFRDAPAAHSGNMLCRMPSLGASNGYVNAPLAAQDIARLSWYGPPLRLPSPNHHRLTLLLLSQENRDAPAAHSGNMICRMPSLGASNGYINAPLVARDMVLFSW
jgi:hypothetical protein